jgi:DNA-binding NarL/FixJ family response regulator
MEPIRVMLVDDAADARMLIRLILGEHDDFEVVAEADGAASALAQLKASRPDVVLVDARMPVVDGFELSRTLRAESPGLRVAILTSMADEVTREQSTINGADACLSKGELSALPQTVRDLVSALGHEPRA